MDILDQYLDHTTSSMESDAQTPSLQIYRKTNKLKSKIKTIQLANRLMRINKKDDDKKPLATEVFKQPPCLVFMLSKINKERRENKEIVSEEVNK